MYSDTLIVVISLIIMIIVGLVFRTCCLKLAKQRVSKQRVRGVLRQLLAHPLFGQLETASPEYKANN